MNIFSVDFWESSFVLGHTSAQPEWRFICLISKVSLLAYLALNHRHKGVVGASDAGTDSLSCKFRSYHSDTSVVG